jgi:hypothetical protein
VTLMGASSAPRHTTVIIPFRQVRNSPRRSQKPRAFGLPVVRQYNEGGELKRRIGFSGAQPVLPNLGGDPLIAPHGRDEFEHM